MVRLERRNWDALLSFSKVVAFDVEGTPDSDSRCFTIVSGPYFATRYSTSKREDMKILTPLSNKIVLVWDKTLEE